jgi:hypothetical protein
MATSSSLLDIIPRCQIDKQYEKYKVANIVHEVEDGKCTLEYCEKACKALASISGIAMQTRNAEILLEFLDKGVCELIVVILNKFGIDSPAICNYTCQTICNMCYSSRELQEFLGEIGVCELVVFVTGLHIGDPDVGEYGASAICLLAQKNHPNSMRLADANVFECLTQVGNFGFNLKHERASLVASLVCAAFSILCEAANALPLLECGSDQLVIALLKCHRENRDFIPYGIKAICALASLNFEHRETLGKNGICMILFSILKSEDRENVIQEGVEAVMHLSVNPSNSRRLKDAEAAIWIIKFLEERLTKQPLGAEVCSGAILNLISKGPAMNDHYLQLQQCNGVDVLRRAEQSKITSFKARENIFHIMETIDHFMSNERLPARPSYRLSEERDDRDHKGTGNGALTQLRSNEISIDGLPTPEKVQSLPPNVREYVEFRRMSSTNINFSDR